MEEIMCKCDHCGRPIYKGSDTCYGEEYVEIEGYYIHWDCVTEFLWKRKKEAV